MDQHLNGLTNTFIPEEQLKGYRILAGPSDIAGFTSRMAQAAAGAGANVLFFNANVHKFNPDVVESKNLRRLLWQVVQLSTLLKKKGVLGRAAGTTVSFIARVIAFQIACTWADTVIMVGGKGLIASSYEYAFLRFLGKQVIHIFVGTASRPRYLSGYTKEGLAKSNCRRKSIQKLAQRTARQAARVKGISRNASIVVENPLCGHFHEKRFINFFKLGVPLNVDTLLTSTRISSQTPPRNSNKIRILHCPSRPEIKGSTKICEVVNSLIDEGLPIDLRLISNISHEQVLYEISQADIVIDQLYSDSPLAGIAAEAAAFGKVVLVGGYGWSLFPEFLTKQEIPPTVTTHPEKLKATLRSLAINAEIRDQLGIEAQQFLRNTWSDSQFARNFSRLVAGQQPESWWFQPERVRYLHGLGMEECECRAIIKDLIAQTGAQGLRIDHLPTLKQMFVEFAEGKPCDYPNGGEWPTQA